MITKPKPKLINLNVEPSDLQPSLRGFPQGQGGPKISQVTERREALGRHIQAQGSLAFEKKIKEDTDEGLQTNGHRALEPGPDGKNDEYRKKKQLARPSKSNWKVFEQRIQVQV